MRLRSTAQIGLTRASSDRCRWMPGFWSSETMRVRLPTCIAPYDDAAVVNCSYELKLGSQIYVTGGTSKTRRDLRPSEQISIPPGQFAQLLTHECVTVPNDCLALISMKSSQTDSRRSPMTT